MQDVPALRRRAKGLATLLEVTGSLAATLDLDAVLQAATDGVCRVAGFDTAAVYLLEGVYLRIGATSPPLPPDFPEPLRLARLADHPHIGAALASGAPHLVADARTETFTPAEQIAVDQRGLRTILYIPMIAGVGRVGVLIVSDSTGPGPLGAEEVDLCRTLANLAALATTNAKLYRAGEEQASALRRQGEEARRADAARLELERQLLHAQKLESLGLLAGGIAHDFNNLLQAVLGNLDVALTDLPAGSAAREAVEQSAQAARRATDLTRQLLAYSGRGRFVVRPVDLTGLVQENVQLLRASVAHTCAIDLRLAAGLPPVEADIGQLQQVVMNLITNSADAIGPQAGTIVISTGRCPGGPAALAGSRLADVAPSEAYVWLQVSDTGCGMDERTQERLFDPFFSTKGLGRGLGLSAILGIVRGHRGGLFVESAPGRGTTVRVLLPAAPAAGPAEAPAPRAAGPAVSGTVLVVDDEDFVRRACQKMLRTMGLRAIPASGGREAVALLRAHPGEVRFVVLDLSMPEMDGIATLDALLAVEPGLRIILSSGFDEGAAAGRPAAARAAGFIQKPYTMADLREALARAAAP